MPHTLAFQINGTLFPVDPRDFITSVSHDSTDKCFANLVETDTPVEGENYLYSWSLGAPFLKGYVVIPISGIYGRDADPLLVA